VVFNLKKTAPALGLFSNPGGAQIVPGGGGLPPPKKKKIFLVPPWTKSWIRLWLSY